MKIRPSIIALVIMAALAAAFVGCGKGSDAPSSQAYEINGVKIDIPALQEAFVNGTPDQQAAVRDAASSLRYGQYPNALMALDKVANDASLTEPQKKMVNQVIEQMKQLINKAPAQ